jgi:hypothetical protein
MVFFLNILIGEKIPSIILFLQNILSVNNVFYQKDLDQISLDIGDIFFIDLQNLRFYLMMIHH